jgi:hypothetical protein
MKEEKLKKLLNELTDATAEPVSPGLAEDIKRYIPHKLTHHRIGMDTVNIIIDLRINKLTAAAAIIITMVLCANFFGRLNSTDGGIFQGSKQLIKYYLGGDRSDLLVNMSKSYEHLVLQGRDVEFYTGSIDSEDSNAVLMQWKLPDGSGRYSVIFSDSRVKTVSSEELIKLQARMLQKRTK